MRLSIDAEAPADVDPSFRVDLRLALPAAVAWIAALLAVRVPGWLPALLVALVAASVIGRRSAWRWALVGCLLVALTVGAVALLRAEAVATGPVARLAEQRAVVTVEARVRSDPMVRSGRYGDLVVVRLDVHAVEGRGWRYPTSAPVVVLGDRSWTEVDLGDAVTVTARLGPSDDADAAAVLSGGEPRVTEPAGAVHRAAARVRQSIRDAVRAAPEEGRQIVPALVVGDDAGMGPDVVEDFRTTGLTHLTAVSGTNLTLVVGFLLVLARAAGVRARGLVVVGLLGVVGFVLVARTEPSVVRAAAMGTVALIGMGSDGRHRGVRALSVATLGLLHLDPWLAVSYGFALSVLATGGILLVGPWFRDQLATWVPAWLAAAVAVPLAAQLACTPVVALLSDEVSLVAVAANMAVAPAVAPATVLGLGGGLVHLVVPFAGGALGAGAGWCGWWIVRVAQELAVLPGASVAWPAGPGPLLALTVLCLALVPGLAWLLRRRAASLIAVAALVSVMVVPVPTPGWPPERWVMVACDVGQGDGLVLAAGPGRAVVVDAGPEPALMDRCLDRLGVRRIPVLVLTHFHADHVDGLGGVLAGRRVGRVVVSPVADPPDGAAEVRRTAAVHGVPVDVATFGEVGVAGALRWQVVAPVSDRPVPSEGSVANNASVVLLAEVEGVRVLLAGDLEPEGQRVVARTFPDLQVDVLKVPHHGSRHQDTAWVEGLGARVAVVSVGADNDYGHPAPDLVAGLAASGAVVRRTDRAGDVAVVAGPDGELLVVAR